MPMWTVEGRGEDRDFRIVLEGHADKQFSMVGGVSQVYVEYAVTPSEFSFRTKDQTITLKDLEVIL